MVLAALLLAPASGSAAERARLTWNTETDIDLHVYDDAGNYAWYGSPGGIPGASLSDDDTVGFGPETFSDDDTGRTFRYCVHYYGPGDSGDETPPTNITLAITEPDGTSRTVSRTLGGVDDFHCPPPIEHYRIELKAWIAKAAVVDPIQPVSFPYVLSPLAPCFVPPTVLDRARAIVRTTFRGDGHDDYGGSWRVRPVAEFDWDGTSISNLRAVESGDDFGETHRDWQFAYGSSTSTCTTSGRATSATSVRAAGGNGLELEIASANPLVPLSPDIDSLLRGALSASPTESMSEGPKLNTELSLDYETDHFPSHGFFVRAAGTGRSGDAVTGITNDTSCLGDDVVLGLTGAGLIAKGLTSRTNRGSLTIRPGQDSGLAVRGYSGLCSGSYLRTDVPQCRPSTCGTSSSPRAREQLRAAGGKAVKVKVAPVTNGGLGAYVSLKNAAASGLVAVTDGPGSLAVILSQPSAPVAIRVSGPRALLQTTQIVDGAALPTRSFGPKAGPLVVRADADPRVEYKGKTLGSRSPDSSPPRTTAEVKRKAADAVVRFTASDASAVLATYARYGSKAANEVNGSLRVPQRQLRSLRFASVDVFGNREKERRLSKKALNP